MDLTPRKIVEELDRYIVGQKNAKRAVAIAIRPEDMRVADIAPGAPNRVEADVVSREFLGAGYRLELTLAGNARQPITLEISANRARTLGVESVESLSIQLPPDMIRVFPKES